MKKSKIDLSLIARTSFKYELYHKNYGMFDISEPFYLMYDGTISKIRLNFKPETIGIFFLCVINLDNSDKFCGLKDSVVTFLKHYQLYEMVTDPDFNILNEDRIILLNNAIIHPKYRGKGVFEELVKSIMITHYTKNSIFVVNAKTIQSNDNEMLFFKQIKWPIWDDNVPALKKDVFVSDYFELDKLPPDDEYNEFKLYAKMQSLNLKQYKDTPFFYYENKKDFMEFYKSNLKAIKES